MALSHYRRKVSNKIRIHKIFPAILYKILWILYKIAGKYSKLSRL